jgi:hypothetical protein
MRDVVTLAEEWVNAHISAANVPLINDQIYPGIAPAAAVPPFITHDMGYADPVAAIGRSAVSLYVLRWEVTTWNEGPGRQSMAPVWNYVFAALLGAEGEGLQDHLFTSLSDGSQWSVASGYYGPMPSVVLEPSTEGEWQRITHGILLYLTPL